MTTTEALIESPPLGCVEVASLYQWSTNYDAGTGPFTLFLDLIGYSQEEFGETLYNLNDASLGYVELDYLADALKAYTISPTDVSGFVQELLDAESGDDDDEEDES